MNLKTVSVSGIVGGIVNFLLGWLFYGTLFKDSFPPYQENSNFMIFIFLGCLTFSLFIAYIYTHWATISTLSTGAKAGAIIGFFVGLFYNFFNLATAPEVTVQMVVLDVALNIIMTGITGAAIGLVIGKLKKS